MLVKYNLDGRLLYGTLIGGSLDHETAARSLAIDDNGMAYVGAVLKRAKGVLGGWSANRK